MRNSLGNRQRANYVQEHRIERTGRSPLVFNGELIARAEPAGEDLPPRYHQLSVYHTSGGQYVAHRHYVTTWKDEVGNSEAEAVELAALEEWLTDTDPCEHVRGYPLGKQFEAKQARLLSELRQHYAHQVGQVLAAVDGAEDRVE